MMAIPLTPLRHLERVSECRHQTVAELMVSLSLELNASHQHKCQLELFFYGQLN